MEFGRHIWKGLWAFADKSLPLLYGLGFIFLVVRQLPPKEYGAFTLAYTIFLVITALLYSLIFQPMTKLIAGKAREGEYIGAGLLLGGCFVIVVSVGIYLLSDLLVLSARYEDTGSIRAVLLPLILLLITALYRIYAVSYLQAKYRIKEIFCIDAVNFMGALVIIAVVSHQSQPMNAIDVMWCLVYAQVCSMMVALSLTIRVTVRMFQITSDAFREILQMGKYTFAGVSLFTLFSQTDIYIISFLLGVVPVAAYGASKIVTRIFDVVSQVVQLFVMPFSSHHANADEKFRLKVVMEKTIFFSSLAMLPVILILIIFPEQVLSILYHGKYIEGAAAVRFFGISGVLIPMNATLVAFFVGTADLKKPLLYGIAQVIIAIIGYWILIPILGIGGAAAAYAFSFILITILLFRYVQGNIPIEIKGIAYRYKDIQNFLSKNRTKWFEHS